MLDIWPPYTYISKILLGPSFSFKPYVLQIKQKTGPLTFKYLKVQTLTTKFHFLLNSKNPPHGIPYSLYVLFIFLSSLIHFHFQLLSLLISPQNSALVLCSHSSKKKILTNFFFLLAF